MYQKAKQYYKKNKDKYDLIIDEINTRPFMTPKYASKPIVAVIHQLAREFWFYETPFPLSWFGYHFLERNWLSAYTHIPTVTVSASTRNDLLNLGFDDVTIVPQGLSVEPRDYIGNKESNPTLVFIGRLTKAKMPDHAVKGF